MRLLIILFVCVLGWKSFTHAAIDVESERNYLKQKKANNSRLITGLCIAGALVAASTGGVVIYKKLNSPHESEVNRRGQGRLPDILTQGNTAMEKLSAKPPRFTESTDLSRFIDAQKKDLDTIESELNNGKKIACWIWYIFPQYHGLSGSNPSANAEKFSIKSLDEARQYLAHNELGIRLINHTKLVLKHTNKTPDQIFGKPLDSRKFKSSMTLFERAATDEDTKAIFSQALKTFFNDERDQKTLELIDGRPMS